MLPDGSTPWCSGLRHIQHDGERIFEGLPCWLTSSHGPMRTVFSTGFGDTGSAPTGAPVASRVPYFERPCRIGSSGSAVTTASVTDCRVTRPSGATALATARCER